jgi:beta-lactamase superfamily II metal-dependent hydrolase
MFDFFKKATPKQKKIYISIATVFLAVCLLIELIGMIPGIPFNGWSTILEACGIKQGYLVPEGELEVHFIDVGNADCILVRQGEHNMLIDSGDVGAYNDIVDYLNRHNVKKFDLVIATHPHADHIGEMADIIQNFPIDRFVMSYMPTGKEPTTNVYLSMLEALDERNVPVDEAQPGKTYTLGTARLQILAPISESSDPNAMSVVTRLTFGDRAFLFTGDAEEEVEREILTRGFDVKADVLKAGHHGSKTSSSDPFVRAVAPSYAVITCGEGNSYQHPHDEALERLEDVGATCYRADLCGDIVFTVNEDGAITVETQKGD